MGLVVVRGTEVVDGLVVVVGATVEVVVGTVVVDVVVGADVVELVVVVSVFWAMSTKYRFLRITNEKYVRSLTNSGRDKEKNEDSGIHVHNFSTGLAEIPNSETPEKNS